VGVNKYAQHDADSDVPRDVDVRKIDNTAVLQKQKERLKVSLECGVDGLGECCCYCCGASCTVPTFQAFTPYPASLT